MKSKPDSEMLLHLRAMWVPLLSRSQFKLLSFFCIVVLAVAALCLPSSPAVAKDLYAWLTRHIADVRLLSLRSKFPFATAVTYGFALLMAPLMGIALCLTHMDAKHIQNFLVRKSLLTRIIHFIGVFVVIIAFPFLVEIDINPSQRSAWVRESIGENRLILLFWSSGTLLVHSVFWMLIFSELANLLRFVLRRDGDS